MARTEAEQRDSEDALHVGATRPAMLLGLPMVLSVVLLATAYLIWINVTGLRGALWAACTIGPLWIGARLAVGHDPYGIAVLQNWLITTGITFDRGAWGGASRSPLPHRQSNRARGMRHA